MQRSRRLTQSYVLAADSSATRPSLRAALWVWFACGLMALLAFPALRGFNATIGWLPFWLVIAPLIDLALLRPDWLAATSRALLSRASVVRARRRHRPASQARSLQRRRVMRTSPRPRVASP